MGRKYFAAVLLCSACLASAAHSAGELELYQLQKVIMELQARSVKGDARASGRAKELIDNVEGQFEKMSKEKLSSRKNTAAAVAYVLSGGASAPVRRALAIGKFSERYRRVLEGALAYSEGEVIAARQMLDPVDPLAADPILSGPLAFARGTLAMSSDYATALRMYDIVRLVSPKSAFDEAAMRRRAIIHADKQELENFLDLSIAYFRYFPKSQYAASFRAEGLSILKKSLEANKGIPPQKLIKFFESQEAAARTRAIAEFIREAILYGNIGIASSLLEMAQKAYPEIAKKQEFSEYQRIASNMITYTGTDASIAPANPQDSSTDSLIWSQIRQAIAKKPDLSPSGNANSQPATSTQDWKHASSTIQELASSTQTLLKDVRTDLGSANQP